MRRYFITALALIIAVAQPALAKDLYVATDGLDTNSGAKDKPLATIQKAQDAASPGDTVFIRGGTYKIPENQIARKQGIFAYVTYLDKSGTKDAPINYFAAPGEKPVFDLAAVKPANLRVDAFYVTGSWLRFKGLTVTGVQVTITGHTQSICFDNEGSDNIFEQLLMHDGMAIGYYSTRGARNLVLNCDAYNNYDSVSEGGRGGNTDGFGCHPAAGGVGNVFHGCRAWFNSDDGYDCINAHEFVTWENSWSMYNGYSTTMQSLGDGNGFKAGGYGATPVERLPNPIPHHIVRQCLAVGNKANGFYSNHHIGTVTFLNDTAYGNGINFNFQCRLADNRTDVPGYDQVIKNNLGYKVRGRNEVANWDPTKNKDVAANYFTMDLTITDKDFLGLDEKELTKPRGPDGELPAISFMHLAPGSQLIDKGVDVKLPYNGKAPDLGAFETK